jgi:hypothetical protein
MLSPKQGEIAMKTPVKNKSNENQQGGSKSNLAFKSGNEELKKRGITNRPLLIREMRIPWYREKQKHQKCQASIVPKKAELLRQEGYKSLPVLNSHSICHKQFGIPIILTFTG